MWQNGYGSVELLKACDPEWEARPAAADYRDWPMPRRSLRGAMRAQTKLVIQVASHSHGPVVISNMRTRAPTIGAR